MNELRTVSPEAPRRTAPRSLARAMRGPLAAVSAFILAAGALAEPPPADDVAPRTPPPSQPADRAGHPGDREGPRAFLDLPPAERRARFREFLLNRIDRIERTREALQKAKVAFENGEPIEKIIEEFPPDLRPGGPRGGPPGMGGPGDPGATDLNELGPVVPTGDDGAMGDGGGMRRPGGGRGGPGGPGGPGPQGNRGDHEARDGREPLTDADRQAFNQFLAAAAPNVQLLMSKLREKDPDRADAKLREAMPRVGWLLELNRRDPEHFRLRLDDIRHGREALDASRAVAAYDRDHPDAGSDAKAERDRLVQNVKTALEQQYEVRSRLMEREISRLDSDITKRRTEFDARPAARAAAIDRAAERLCDAARDSLRNPKPRPPHRGSGDPDDDAPPRRRGRD